MQNNHVRWGILGCGDVTEVKSGPALQKAARSSLVAVMRRDGAKAADYARRHGVPKHYDDADALIGDDEVDAVYIATPPSSHKTLALKALAAGKPILVEKPMALDGSECGAMAEAAAQAKRSLTIAYYRRALPRFEALRSIVQSGEIGAVHAVSVIQIKPAEDTPAETWKRDPATNGGGLFVDVQTHVLDWLAYTLGPPEAVTGQVRRLDPRSPCEDTIHYLVSFPGAAASGACSFASAPPQENVTIHCEKGRASMGFLRPSVVEVTTPTGSYTVDKPDPPHVHQPFVERLIAHYLDGAPNPCPPEDGRIATDIVDTLYADYRGRT
ncbi:MAG: Gfo/Idh/MocA family oxidoreductase [Pseudomonadota bacterium]